MAKRKASGSPKLPETQTQKLTDMQRLFIAEYLIDLNATRAATAAGYSPETARQMGSENLSKPYIREEIERRLGQRLDKIEATADNIVNEVKRLAFTNFGRFIKVDANGSLYHDFRGATRDELDCIAELMVEEYTEGRGEDKVSVRKTKFKRYDKLAAQQLLGRYRKIQAWTDRHEHNIDDLGKLLSAIGGLSDEKLAAFADGLTASENGLTAGHSAGAAQPSRQN